MPVEHHDEPSSIWVWARFTLLLMGMVCSAAVSWGMMRTTVSAQQEEITSNKTDVTALKQQDVQELVAIEGLKGRMSNAESELAASRNSQSQVQQTLNEISGKIGVLMERTDPNHKEPGGSHP